MTAKTRQAQLFSGPVDFDGPAAFNGAVTPGADNAGPEPTPNAAAGVTLAFSRLRNVRHMRLTVAAAEIAIADADDFGSVKLVDMADSNIVILGFEADLTLTKDGVGILATTDMDVAVGTAAASNTTLATTMLNVIDNRDIDGDTADVAFDAHSNDNGTPALVFGDDAGLALYLNISAPTETSEDGSVLASGTVDIFFIDTGNVTS